MPLFPKILHNHIWITLTKIKEGKIITISIDKLYWHWQHIDNRALKYSNEISPHLVGLANSTFIYYTFQRDQREMISEEMENQNSSF